MAVNPEDRTIEPNTTPDVTSQTAGADIVAEYLRLIQQSLDDDKAEQVVTIDLTGKTSIADFLVIASGRSTRQVAAMADHLARKLKDAGAGTVGVEGLPRADWVLIDAKDIIVHLFRPEVRSFYKLEKMWGLDTPVEPSLEFVSGEDGFTPLDETPVGEDDEE